MPGSTRSTACVKRYGFPAAVIRLVEKRTIADGSYSKSLQSLPKLDLLTLDDWGLEPLTAAQRNDLMEIMDDRHDFSSPAMISQLPTDQWYQSISDNTLADAILDRLMHNAHRISLKGESMKSPSKIDGW